MAGWDCHWRSSGSREETWGRVHGRREEPHLAIEHKLPLNAMITITLPPNWRSVVESGGRQSSCTLVPLPTEALLEGKTE